MQVVMGIDPGAANLGFGIVRVDGGPMVALDGGVVETPADLPIELRLERIHRELAELISWHEPKAMALEDVFFGKNVRSAMAVGQASGVAMLAAAERGLRCFTYTPQAIKVAVCGSGGAGSARSSAWSARCSACRSHPPPTTRLTRSRSRSATAAAPGAGDGRGGARRRRAGGRMIAAVRGEVMVRRPDHVVIDAGGVGYRLTVSAETLKAVPATGRDAFLHAQLVSREDSLSLYGFASEEERDLFEADLGQRCRSQGRDRGALGRPGTGAAAGDRGGRRQTLPGGAGDRQAHRRADHRRAARQGRR